MLTVNYSLALARCTQKNRNTTGVCYIARFKHDYSA